MARGSHTLIATLLAEVGAASWFAAVGEAPTPAEREEAVIAAEDVGPIAAVADWETARALIQGTGWNREWWRARELRRRDLLSAAEARLGASAALAELSEVMRVAGDRVHGAAAIAATRAGLADPGLARAAAGAATEATYLAALARLAGRPDPAFEAGFRLFQAGRWPLGPIDGAFRLF